MLDSKYMTKGMTRENVLDAFANVAVNMNVKKKMEAPGSLRHQRQDHL